jgi:hypothetical protein
MPDVRPDWRRLPVVVHNDPIFFHKSQVRIGSRLRCFGRSRPATTWVAQRIWTFNRRGRSYVTAVQTLRDVVELRCEETGERLDLRFGSISYSAIWRLES